MRSIFQAFASKRMGVILLLGFSSGLPLGLTGSSLQAWMTDEKIDLSVIGLFSLVGLPYTLKFLWAPLIDTFSAPFFFARLGRRRGWIALFQLLLVVTVLLMGQVSPSSNPWALALCAFLVSFFSASQDIVVDAYRAEALPKEELGAGTGVSITGYRLAMLASGAMALILADHLTWPQVYALLALGFVLGLTATAIADEPLAPPQVEGESVAHRLREGVVGPFVDFFGRSGALEILFFLAIYKLGDVVAGSMTTPFLLQTGFTKTDIGAVYKVFGMIATILGGIAGGAIMMRLGLKASLGLFGILQAATNVLFAGLAMAGAHYPLLVTTVVLENLAGGMGTAAYAAFMMTLCRARFTASQYALLSSLMAVARVFVSSFSGFMAQSLGWATFFWVSVGLALPGLLLLSRFQRWEDGSQRKNA